ncbi:hypothetical protein B0E45_02200 [Sinorhizobium sp. A49]|uniref:hypothetical protein n=1 Tax=Sinorhizobium sp. A49 TaxID=1945861 RepID=UPI00098635A8|nr:hypothetical protein [Sinorhizobium sp. A49]OOG75761.1 hypothetical protein B0E45_02200 [Sinorhizobium sp. A49]
MAEAPFGPGTIDDRPVRVSSWAHLLHFSTSHALFADFRHNFFQIFFLTVFALRVDFTFYSSIGAECKVANLRLAGAPTALARLNISLPSARARPKNAAPATIWMLNKFCFRDRRSFKIDKN